MELEGGGRTEVDLMRGQKTHRRTQLRERAQRAQPPPRPSGKHWCSGKQHHYEVQWRLSPADL